MTQAPWWRGAAALWQRLREPSLVRGLLLAQAALVTLLWLGLVAWLLADEISQSEMEKSIPAMQAVVMSAQALADQPEALARVLEQVDRWNRSGSEGVQDEDLLPNGMVMWRGPQRLFASAGLAEALLGPHPPGLHTLEHAGDSWLVLTVQGQGAAAGEQTSLSFVYPHSVMALMVSLEGRGLLVLPLLVSLPLLLLPAWLSVRWALRPWRRLSEEVARRGAQDLEPFVAPSKAQELRPLVSALNRLLAQLREARARERRFVADAAHELRTPLTALNVYADSLRELSAEPQTQALLAGMLRSSERAVRLVNQLLALMRSEAEAQGALQRLDLAQLVPEVLAELAPLARLRQVVLDCEAPESPLWLMARPEGLHALFANLVENAIKYGPQAGTVRLRLWREPGCLRATVADQGPGIAPEWRQAVLSRFTRLPDQAQPGSGLGLAIADSVMQAQGGSLQLDDAPGGGLLVLLCWPDGAEPAALSDGVGAAR